MSTAITPRAVVDPTRHDRAAARRESRARCYPEILSQLRGLLSSLGHYGGAEVEATRAWLATHCRGCGVPIEENRTACKACKAEARALGAARA